MTSDKMTITKEQYDNLRDLLVKACGFVVKAGKNTNGLCRLMHEKAGQATICMIVENLKKARANFLEIHFILESVNDNYIKENNMNENSNPTKEEGE
jgi:hypothetical protein